MDGKQGLVEIYFGRGRGKSTAAFGQAVQAAADGTEVIVVQFLKEKKNMGQGSFLSRLEPEIRIFRFERTDGSFSGLKGDEKEDAVISIRNGINYARKVLTTGECGLLVLDEVLGILEQGIVSIDSMRELLSCRAPETSVILTGLERCPGIEDLADQIYTIDVVKDITRKQ